VPNGWTRSSILSPCDTLWPAPNGVVAEAETNIEMVLHGSVNLDLLHQNRETGVATTFKDRRRRAACYRSWPSHLDDVKPVRTARARVR
jgi:predicted amidohydrolase